MRGCWLISQICIYPNIQLNREGMTLNQQGELIPRASPDHARDLPLDWSKVQTDKGTELLVNQSTGAILTEPSPDFLQAFEYEDKVLGGEFRVLVV